jgi:CRISPR/Cas system-associated exonuclease Cas4 (RecB family)
VVVYNEREIMTSSGKTIIPDRLVVFKNLTAVVIDYKTGEHYDKYEAQLEKYATIIEEMGYNVVKKILVYINDGLQVIEC